MLPSQPPVTPYPYWTRPHPHWTGGQYSLCRAIFGLALAASLARSDLAPIGLAAVAAAVAFAAGFHDRAASLVLLVAGAALVILGLVPARFAAGAVAYLVAAHWFTPPAPYGSWSALGRTDPGGGWFLPLGLFRATQAAAVVGFLFGPFTRGRGAVAAALAALALFAFDPGWVRRRGAGRRPETLFYDGTCGLCHGAVRFFLAEDADGTALRFATLQGDRFTAAIDATRRAGLPDSLVLLTRHGRVLTRSRAVRRALMDLGGYWKILGTLAGAVPRPILDLLYDGVARTRHALFARPPAACPIVPRALRARFID
jgi:predicted DCC family thiol-disulfide oxidoreductase YuxK